MKIAFELNGRAVEWQAAPEEKALELLRRKGFKSVKWGCGEGDCGACTILLDGRAVRACLLMAFQLQGRRVITAEALSPPGKLHPLQQAFLDEGAVQCGYCTPGMLLSALALLEEKPSPTEDDVREALDGNLCRCTGYQKILRAVLEAARRMGQ
jgi:carbon-monoxide dehydrogenase small subunit